MESQSLGRNYSRAVTEHLGLPANRVTDVSTCTHHVYGLTAIITLVLTPDDMVAIGTLMNSKMEKAKIAALTGTIEQLRAQLVT